MKARIPKLLIAALGGLALVGVASIALISPDETGSAVTVDAGWPAALADLADENQTDPRVLEMLEALASQLEKQQAQYADLAAELAELKANTAATTLALAIDDPASPDAAANREANRRQSGFRGRRGKVQRDDLIKAGFDSYQADEIVTLADQTTLNRLNMEYQATREGWRESTEYRERMAELPSIRDNISREHGEDAYDRYLYASGRPNRIVVRDIYTSSAAEDAGLQAGDKVIAMANSRVYSISDLRSIATSGPEGEMVPVTVERQGSQFEVFIPRGPLGVRSERGYENPTRNGD